MDKRKILEKRPRSRSPRIEDCKQSPRAEDTVTTPLNIRASTSRNNSPVPKNAKNLLDLSPSFHNGGSSGNLPELCSDNNNSRPGSGSSSGKGADDTKNQKSLLELCPAFHNTQNSTVSNLTDRGSPRQRDSPDRPGSRESNRSRSTQKEKPGNGQKKVHFPRNLEPVSKTQPTMVSTEPQTNIINTENDTSRVVENVSNPDQQFMFQAASKVLKSEVEITSRGGADGSPVEQRKYPAVPAVPASPAKQLASSSVKNEPKIFMDKRSKTLVVIAGDGGKVDLKDGKYKLVTLILYYMTLTFDLRFELKYEHF